MGLKNKIHKWLFPEYDDIELLIGFMETIQRGMKRASEQPLKIEGGPVFILGSIMNTKVDIHSEPQIDLYLSKVTLDALRIDGNQHLVSNNLFQGAETVIKMPDKENIK